MCDFPAKMIQELDKFWPFQVYICKLRVWGHLGNPTRGAVPHVHQCHKWRCKRHPSKRPRRTKTWLAVYIITSYDRDWQGYLEQSPVKRPPEERYSSPVEYLKTWVSQVPCVCFFGHSLHCATSNPSNHETWNKHVTRYCTSPAAPREHNTNLVHFKTFQPI